MTKVTALLRNTVPRDGRLPAFLETVSLAIRSSLHPASMDPSGSGTTIWLIRFPAGSGAVPAQGNGDVDRHGEVLDGFPSAFQEPAETAGGHRKEYIVHRGLVFVRNLGDHLEVAADQRQSAVRTDELVEAGLRSRFLGEDFPHGGPPVADPADRRGWVADDLQGAAQPVDPSLEVVAE